MPDKGRNKGSGPVKRLIGRLIGRSFEPPVPPADFMTRTAADNAAFRARMAAENAWMRSQGYHSIDE